ncbi:MAG TPA: type III-B CRISPR module-associated Cmr3 family protein [Streptosporangiaceae bacterium]|nr:type III-B CRISPR module-associated Cmr3 family protein [Streptosporangiaceae bacterium]
MSASSWLAFTPRDTVFVRDGRSFDAASDALAQTVRPGPTTIAGAVGGALGRNLDQIRKDPFEVRGPVLARKGTREWEPYFPAPADLVVTEEEPRRVYRLRPVPADGQTDLDESGDRGGRPLRWLAPAGAAEHAGPLKPLHGWMPGRVLAEYLAEKLPVPGGTELSELRLAEPLVPERRVGLARDGRNARAGFLYQATHLRPEDGWAFLAELTMGGEELGQVLNQVPFGGRGRLADVGPAAVSWPRVDAAGIGPRVLVYLATPAIWPGGWQLPVPERAWLVAAATGEPEPAATVTPGAGWQDSRALRWAVPAGSVYLLEFGDAGAGARWAREWSGVALRRHERAGDVDLLRTAGFGVVLTGAWT